MTCKTLALERDLIRRDLNSENMLQGSSEEREARKNLQKQLSDERRVSFGVGGMATSLMHHVSIHSQS